MSCSFCFYMWLFHHPRSCVFSFIIITIILWVHHFSENEKIRVILLVAQPLLLSSTITLLGIKFPFLVIPCVLLHVFILRFSLVNFEWSSLIPGYYRWGAQQTHSSLSHPLPFLLLCFGFFALTSSRAIIHPSVLPSTCVSLHCKRNYSQCTTSPLSVLSEWLQSIFILSFLKMDSLEPIPAEIYDGQNCSWGALTLEGQLSSAQLSSI